MELLKDAPKGKLIIGVGVLAILACLLFVRPTAPKRVQTQNVSSKTSANSQSSGTISLGTGASSSTITTENGSSAPPTSSTSTQPESNQQKLQDCINQANQQETDGLQWEVNYLKTHSSDEFASESYVQQVQQLAQQGIAECQAEYPNN